MSLKIKNKNGEWVVDQKAIQTSIIDLEGNFESKNVEGALRELASRKSRSTEELEGKVELNRIGIENLKSRVTKNEEDIEYLKANGGGGGGTIVPTITSTFTDCEIEKGQDINIPIFFSSPSGGTGTAYISVNNIEVSTAGVKQGNNTIKVLGTYLTQTENTVGIYVRDRAGIASNQLNFNVVAGGITLTTTFDYEVDYGITDTIKMPYSIETGVEDEILLHLTVNGVKYEIPSVNGYNEYTLSSLGLSLGTHSVSMYATVGKYTSNTISFNVAIVSTTELYLSSKFISGTKFTYGVPIPVDYRLSKISTETYTVELIMDGKIEKTQRLQVGSYYWTITNLAVGVHTLTIRAYSDDGLEDVYLSLVLEIEKGEYTPVEDYSYGLLCDLNAIGKSNQDSSGDIWVDESGNGNNGKLIGFNFNTNGFINDELVCDNDAYIEIPWSPWASNALNGSTIDIIYTPINSGIEDCRVLDYTSVIDDTSKDEIKPFKGVFADILQTIASSASSGASASKTNLDDESGEIHLTWVLDRENKFFKIYINGILSRIMFLTDDGAGTSKFYEDFSHDNYIYLNSTKGLNCGTNNIKRFRVYGHALTSDQVLQNHIANIKDLEKQEEVYNFNYNNTTLPKMYLYGDITNMTNTQTVDMRIEYISPNEEKFGSSFNTGIQNNPVCIQGTSSLAYVRKNYTIYLRDEYGSPMFYNPYGDGSVEEEVFCLKADYIESSHANNTGLAKLINDCVYDTKLPTQLDNPNCRTTINGFPIEVYMNGEYLGIYNFNHDRYSTKSFGYDYKKFPNMLVYEINSNSNVSAGAFYQYGENAESSANISERDYYARDFKLIYGNRTSSNDNYAEIKELVQWVSVAEYDLFKETINEHFNKEYLFRYLLTVLMVGGVDSLGKNLKINTFDGKVWYPTFYDLDTSLGIDNTGYLNIPADVEIEEGSFNTSNSNLWTKVMEYFATDLKEEWAKMRQKNFTLENIMKYVYDEQISVIPAKYYNDDAQVKYLDFGSLYTYCCHGSKEHLIKRWLRERIAYVDSMLEYFTSQHEQIIMRMNKTGEVSFNVTSYIPLYFSVKWSNAQGGTQTIRVERNKPATFTFNSTTATDQEVIVYHSPHVKRLDNLSNLNLSSCILSNATKLTEVEVHSPLLYNINVTENKFLRKLDLSGCSSLGTVTAVGTTLDLSKCNYLKYVDTRDTSLTEIIFNSKGGSLREIYYPKTVQSLTLIKQPLLEILGLPYGNTGEEIPTSLYTVNIQDCTLIKKLNTSINNSINTSMASMSYCNNLTIRNSLDLSELTFNGFKRLKNITVENMPKIKKIGFDNMLSAGQQGTLGYVGLSNCPNITTITMNCSNNSYEINFLDNAILDVGKLNSLKKISSNCVIKGLKTLIVPKQLEEIDFKLQYGTGTSNISNIWVSDQCNVNTNGNTATATHINNGYEGIDFKGMNIKTLNMAGFGQVKNGINFNISPTITNPNLNTNRDGSDEKPWFRPYGVLDLRNYELDYQGIFKGLDLDRLSIIMPENDLTYSDLTSLFEGCTFENISSVNSILAKFPSATKLDYIFKNSDITDATGLVFPTSRFSLKGGFMGSKLISDIDFPLNVVDVTDCFKDCKELKYVTSNWNKSYTYPIKHTDCYYSCTNIEAVDGVEGYLFGIPFDWGGHGFENSNTGLYIVEIPNDDYTVTLGDLLLDGTIDWGDGTFSHNTPNHKYNKSGIYTIQGKVFPNKTGISPSESLRQVLLNVNRIPTETNSFENMFNGCSILRIVDLSQVETRLIQNTNRMFKDCISIITPPDFDFTSISQADEMYAGCSNIISLTFKNLANSSISCENIVNGCTRLTTIGFAGKTQKGNAKKIIDIFNRFLTELSVNTVELSNKVDIVNSSIENINNTQDAQNKEILVNLMASTDLFEMFVSLMDINLLSSTSLKANKAINNMTEVYATLIIKNKKKIDDVPSVIKSQVENLLEEFEGVE